MKYDLDAIVQNRSGEMVKIDYGRNLNELAVIANVTNILAHPNDEEFWYKFISFEIRRVDL